MTQKHTPAGQHIILYANVYCQPLEAVVCLNEGHCNSVAFTKPGRIGDRAWPIYILNSEWEGAHNRSNPSLLADNERLRQVNAGLVAALEGIANAVAFVRTSRVIPHPLRDAICAIEDAAEEAITKAKVKA